MNYMKQVLLFAFFLLLIILEGKAQNNPIYNFKIDSVAGSSKIDFDLFRGKKILIVNTASGDSSFNTQFKELMQLYQIFYGKLVIIVVPTNSFNTETGTNQQVAARYTQTYKYKFPVTERLQVRGNQIHQLYKWLTNRAENNVADYEAKRPFYKYLIDENGNLIASFNDKMGAMNEIIQNIISK